MYSAEDRPPLNESLTLRPKFGAGHGKMVSCVQIE